VPLTRYMTSANRHDFLDALLVDISRRKQERIMDLINKRLKRTKEVKAKCVSDLVKNERLAREDKVDPGAAVQAFKREYRQPVPAQSDEHLQRSNLEVRCAQCVTFC
jgi:hypothetical protein